MTILTTVLQTILMIIVPSATTILTYYLKQFLERKINANFAAEQAEYLKRGIDLIYTSVGYVQQTYVDSLKKQNIFDTSAQRKALDLARDKATELMNDEIQTAIIQSYGNLNTFIETTIEQIIAEKQYYNYE